jgi:MFS family permease
MSRRSISYFSLLSFLASLYAFLTIYINSSVVAQESYGVLFITPIFLLAYAAAVVGFFYSPHVLKRIGNAWYLVLLGAIEATALVILAYGPHGGLLFGALVVHLTAMPLIGLSLDIFFEGSMVHEEGTGTARGFFLTLGNTALVISPLIVGILAAQSFSFVYVLSLIILLMFLCATIPALTRYKDPHYQLPTLHGMWSTMTGSLGAVIASQLVLRIFFAFAAIYMPLLLLARGFSWGEIGLILGIALLPFMLFELPLGHIADTFLGEKEVLILGFIILSASTTLLMLAHPASVALYALIFFATRTGAAMVEITTETNFFRNVGVGSTSAITLFRMTNAIGGLIGVALAAIALYFVDLPLLFAFFGLFVLLGIPFARHITDSR